QAVGNSRQSARVSKGENVRMGPETPKNSAPFEHRDYTNRGKRVLTAQNNRNTLHTATKSTPMMKSPFEPACQSSLTPCHTCAYNSATPKHLTAFMKKTYTFCGSELRPAIQGIETITMEVEKRSSKVVQNYAPPFR